ncbi:MAG: MoaD/ThiS family protein [Nocardioides sp.]
MGPSTGASLDGEITVHLWAAAKAAAGTGLVVVSTPGPISLAAVVDRVVEGRPERLVAVLAGCAVLVGDRPVSTQDPAEVLVGPGDTVEFLPPFAGG